MYNIISTGSQGNAIIYHNQILVDCGIPFSLIKPFLHQISLVAISHKHNDHLNVSTLKKMQSHRPSLRVAVGEYLLPLLADIKNIDIIEIGKWYNYGAFSISPIQLYHDVPNFGYRIFKDGHRTLHVTDTAHMQGITAPGYNLYAIEANYDEDRVHQVIASKKAKGEYAHQIGSINSHLSLQQAHDFILKNADPNTSYEVIHLHQSSEF